MTLIEHSKMLLSSKRAVLHNLARGGGGAVGVVPVRGERPREQPVRA